jgi:cell division protein FtsN
MRDINPRSRERFELSLDGRQIASVVVGAIVVLGVVFVLGLNVGKQLARAEARPAPAGDALAALDQGPAPGPAVRDESLTYHDRLVKERPAAAAPATPPRPPEEPPRPQAPAAEPPPPEPPPAPAAPAPVEQAPSDPPPAARPAAPSARPVAEGDWCVQLGAANDRGEAERLAAKFARFSPRIEEAVLQGKTWYRVRVGAFATKAAAEKYMKDLARETGAKGYVTSTH